MSFKVINEDFIRFHGANEKYYFNIDSIVFKNNNESEKDYEINSLRDLVYVGKKVKDDAEYLLINYTSGFGGSSSLNVDNIPKWNSFINEFERSPNYKPIRSSDESKKTTLSSDIGSNPALSHFILVSIGLIISAVIAFLIIPSNGESGNFLTVIFASLFLIAVFATTLKYIVSFFFMLGYTSAYYIPAKSAIKLGKISPDLVIRGADCHGIAMLDNNNKLIYINGKIYDINDIDSYNYIGEESRAVFNIFMNSGESYKIRMDHVVTANHALGRLDSFIRNQSSS